VLRTGRKDIAAATLLLDGLKGTAAVLICAKFGAMAGLIAGFAAFLGHIFPVWLKFKGGKGVATFVGCLYGLAWPAGVGFCLVWLLVAYFSRYSSLAALIASAASPLLLWGLGLPLPALVVAAMAIILWWKHSPNIARLRDGTEGRIGQKG
jgi:glycerol-3-phosphate acyltransferase PlsY